MKKKILSLLLTACLLLTLVAAGISVFAEDGPTYKISAVASNNATEGRIVTVTVEATGCAVTEDSGDEAKLFGGNFTLRYDNNHLEYLKKVKKNGTYNDHLAPDAVRLAFATAEGYFTEEGEENILFLKIIFKIKDGQLTSAEDIKPFAEGEFEMFDINGSNIDGITSSVNFTCEHEWGEPEVISAPTCTAPGAEARRCILCGEADAETHEIPSLGHDYEDAVTPPTCTEKGYTTHTCTRCEDTYTDSEVPALGHAWGETEYTWSDDNTSCTAKRTCTRCDAFETASATITSKITKPSTCTEMGETTYTAEFEESWAATDTKVIENIPIDPDAHDWGDWVETDPGDCTTPPTLTRTCRLCGKTDTKTGDAPGHAWGEWVVTTPAGCETAGEETRTCSRCNATETRSIDALGHDWGETEYIWSEDKTTCTAKRTCKRDGCVKFEEETVEAVVTTVEPTCTENGATTYTATFTKNWAVPQDQSITIEALGHNWGEWTVTTPATCTEPGTETHTCSRCGTPETRSIDALGHDWGEVEYEWAEDGGSCTAKHVCKREGCGTPETASATITSAITKPATCMAKGETTYTAEFEESWADTVTKVIEDIPVDPEAHDWGEWIVTTEPTETENGEETRTCSRCGTTETRPVEALGHDWGETTYEWAEDGSSCTAKRTCKHEGCEAFETESATITSEITKPATCTEKGTTTYTATFAAEWAASQVKSIDIEALGHDYKDVVTPPTCTEKGYTTHTCTRCEDTYTDSEVPALGHDWGEWVVTTPAGCETAGEETRTCSRCDVPETRPVEALGHDWGETTYEWSADNKTCTAKRTCKHESCDAFEEETVSAVVTTIEPTCTEKGTTTYTATFAAEWAKTQVKSIDIDAAGHSFGTEWKSDDTNHWHECSCGEKADAAEHDFDWVIDKEATETEPGSKHEECKICGYKKAAVEIPATSSTEPGIPQTGDESHIALWIFLSIASLGLTAVLLLLSRRRNGSIG